MSGHVSKQSPVIQPHAPFEPNAPGQGSRVRLVGYIAGVLLTIGIVALGFWIATTVRGNPATIATSAPAEPTAVVPLALQRPVVTEDGLVEAIGVKIVYVAVTGGGGLIDLRFQVVDPEKANRVHDADYPPTIVDESTGLVVNQLLMGHAHNGPYTAGQTYYLIFENPGNIVQSGGRVSVLLGNAEVDHIVLK